MARILLIEDNEMNGDMLSRRLRKRGYDIVLARDAEQGLLMAVADPQPDLILMDVGLPGMDGWQATIQLKNDVRTKGIPVIALTAHALSTDREHAFAVGCDDYETKPIDLAALTAKIDNLIHRADPAP